MSGLPNALPPEELNPLRQAAESDDPDVRAAATDRLRTWLTDDFERVFDATTTWTLDPDERLQEVACRALMLPEDQIDLVRARRLIGRAEGLLGTPGRTAAGGATREVLPYLLSLHPRILPEWVQSWTRNPEEPVRADVAGVLAVLAPRFPTLAVDGISQLAVDPRPGIRVAVRSAVQEIAQAQPAMEPFLRTKFPGAL